MGPGQLEFSPTQNLTKAKPKLKAWTFIRAGVGLTSADPDAWSYIYKGLYGSNEPTLNFETSANQSYPVELEIMFYFGFLIGYVVKSLIIPLHTWLHLALPEWNLTDGSGSPQKEAFFALHQSCLGKAQWN